MGRIGIAALVVLVLGATTAMGTSMSAPAVDPLGPSGAVPEAGLVIDGERLSYSGIDATAATLVITNTDSRTHVADIALALETSDGTEVTTAVETSVRFPPDRSQPVEIDFSDTNVTAFDTVVVHIEKSN